ncbi:MAG: ABC transporter ATP-binding protein [Clostridiales bacterium]|nr:ABC transporter ATP-binding protein [Clostridiales bacterium]
MVNAIELMDVVKKYKDFSLEHVSFQVPKGHIVGFVGENGAGKTTCIKAIMNLIKLDEGNIKVFGLEHSKNEKEIKEQIGIVFDECCFHETLQLDDIGVIMSKIYKNWDKEMFKTYVDRFELPHKKIIHDFSRGMKMKLSIAVALSHHAKLLILDEATSGLDPIVRDEILDIFMEFIQDEEHTILVSSHIISDLEKIADYIIFIHQGRVVFNKSKDDLIYQFGVARMSEAEYEGFPSENQWGIRKSRFGVEVLVDNRPELEAHKHDYVIDSTTIEEIILFMVKGGLK